MDYFTTYRIALGFGVLFFGALAAALMRLNPQTLPRVEKLPRARLAGAVLSCAALLWCVPHTRPIAFDWMQMLLLPAALIFPILGYFLLDYLFARGWAGLMILCGYYLVHESFAFHSAGAPVLAVMGWTWGIGGILISAKPCWMRDFIRVASRKPAVRGAAACYCALFALLLLYALIMHLKG